MSPLTILNKECGNVPIHSMLLDSVPPWGFEPQILGLKTRCPRPLDDGGLI